MTISMYQASIPVFVHMLTNLNGILDKAAVHAEAKKIDPGVFVQARLFPDMFTLARQIQIATDMVKGCAARLAGTEPPKYEDNETSFAELKDRVDRTIAYVETFQAAQIDGTEEKAITLSVGGRTFQFTGIGYLLNFVLPNMYFHIAMVYAILRHGGVELGKADFLGKV
jgi:hypothetical protein